MLGEGEEAKVTVANVGDSRIILGKNFGESFVAVTKDHVPTDLEVREEGV
jgi:serine/threonine protein phosphatase PrpC